MALSLVQDQAAALRLLRGIIRRGRIPNGLLFWGPAGVGKTLAATQFAKAVNCMEKDDDACDVCLSCRKTDHANHADIMHVYPAGKGRMIKVEMVEEIIGRAMYRPHEGRRRVVIFHDVDRMNEAAQNHFLKTLEEPPSDTVFILLTEWPRQLLPTIRSRCQRVRFGTLHPETLATMLQQQTQLDPRGARSLASLARGSMSRALGLVNTDRRKVTLDIIHRLALKEDPLLISEDFAAHIQKVEKEITEKVKQDAAPAARNELDDDISPDRDEIDALIVGLVRWELIEYLSLFDAWYRDELIYGVTQDTRIVFNSDHLQQLQSPADIERHIAKLAAIADAWKYITRNLVATRVFRDLFFVLAS